MRLLLCGLLCALSVAPARAQSTLATLTGVVTDQAGAVIPQVAIEATQIATGYRFTATSNEVGLYTAPQLPEGEYSLTAKAAGFQDTIVRDILLKPRDVRRIDVKMNIAALQNRIEVTGGATLIETETPRLADTKSGKLIATLPYSGNGSFYFFQLTPNVTRVNGAYVMRFAGSRQNQSDYSVDGVSFMVSSGSNPNAPLSDYTESVQEMRLDVANNSAEFGTVGQVSLISKSGTNQLHGSAIDFYSSPVLRARDPFALARSSGVQHKPGYTLGGPAYLPRLYDGRNRTFFFSTLELTRASVTTSTLSPTVAPTPWRSGDFSGAGGAAIVDPFANRAPFPGARIPASRLNAVTAKIQERFYPLPNTGDANALSAMNYRQTRLLPAFREWYLTERIDHRFSDKDQVTGRMVRHGYTNHRVSSLLPSMGLTRVLWDTRFYTGSYTRTIRPTVVNEFRFGYSFNNNPRYPTDSGLSLVKDLGLTGLASSLPDYPGVFRVAFSGVGLTAVDYTYQYRDSKGGKNYYFQDYVSWFRGRHAVKVGGQVSHSSVADRFLATNLYGSVTFTNRFTGHPYADFLLGVPTTSRRAAENPYDESQRSSFYLFATDDFRVTPKLTLSLGLRYEYAPGWSGSSIAAFDPGLGKIVVADNDLKAVSPLVPASYVEVVSASQAGYPGKSLMYGDKNNFAPRVGVAWRPFGPDTVLRAGFGVYYDLVPVSRSTAGGSPFTLTEPDYTNPASSPTVILPRVFPEAGSGSLTSITIPAAHNPHTPTPYSMQYNFTVERQQWNTGFRASYIGTNTRQGAWGYNMNQPQPDTQSFVSKARAFPRYPNVYYYTSGAGHQYHSMTLQVNRQTKSGLFLQSYYTLARDIGDLEKGQSPENAYDRRRERAVWQDIPTHRWNATGMYELPVGKGKRILGGVNRWQNLMVGGWEVNAVYTIQSGDFLTPTWTGPDPTGTAYTSSSTPASVTIRPDRLRDANLSADQRTLTRWFDPTAFAAPQAGSFGTSAKGVIKGPGTNLMSATLVKNLNFTERVRLRLELAAMNVLNHPNWSAPGTNISSLAQVGVISGAGGNATGGLDGTSSRIMMFRARLQW
jgi:hypothetical protein